MQRPIPATAGKNLTPDGRIDVQHHILPPRYVEVVGDKAIGDLIVSGQRPNWSPQVSIDCMDRNGIAMAVTSISAPAFTNLPSDAARGLARDCNEFAARMCADFPGRFGMFASLPMPDIDASLRELDHCLRHLSADGVCLMTSYRGSYPGDASFAELFQELDRRAAAVHFHPVDTMAPKPLAGLPAATLEFPFDTTRAAVSLLFSGTLARHRRMKIILSHAGGTLPLLADRICRLERRADFREKVPEGARADLARLHVDTALSASPHIFTALRTIMPMTNVLFASDFPFAPEDTTAATIRGLDEIEMSPAEARLVNRDNALRLMPSLAAKLPAPASAL